MSKQLMRANSSFINHARREVERMTWPEVIPDLDGDRERALQRSYRSTAFWRMAWLFTTAVLFCLVVLLMVGVL